MRKITFAVASVLALVLLMPGMAAASARPVVYKYEWGGARVKPRTIAVSATGQTLIKIKRWNTWGRRKAATAHASEWVDNCKPTCPQGHYVKHPATAVLTRVRRHKGRPYFTRLRFTIKRTGRTSRVRFGPGGWIYY